MKEGNLEGGRKAVNVIYGREGEKKDAGRAKEERSRKWKMGDDHIIKN